MKKKYTIRKRRKTISVLYIFIIIVIILISVSIGYSKFSSQLNILANVSIIKPTVELPTEFSKSYATWEITNSWPGYYEVLIEIVNLDEDINGWVISIDLPSAIRETDIHAWWSSETTYEELGDYDRVTFRNYDYNKDILSGSKLSVPLSFPLNEELNIKHLIINGKMIRNFTQKISET